MVRHIKYKALITALALSIVFSSSAFAGECDDLLDKASQTSILTKQIEIYKQAHEKCPDDAKVNYKYAFSLERLRKYDQALQFYNKAVLLDPSSATYLFGLADVCRMTDDVEGAVDAYQRGLEIQPNNKRAKKSLEAMQAKLAAMPKKAEPVPPPPPPPKPVKKEPVKKKKIDLKIAIKKPSDTAINMVFSTGSTQGAKKYFDTLKDKQAVDAKNWH